MTEIFFWLVISISGAGVAACVAWFMADRRRQEKLFLAEHAAEMQRLRADDEKKVVDIFSKPKPDNWDDTVNKL